MDRKPERITFDPFVLPHETPLDIFSALLLQCLWHTGKRETLAGLSGGRLVYLLVYTYLYLAAMAGETKLSFVHLHTSSRRVSVSLLQQQFAMIQHWSTCHRRNSRDTIILDTRPPSPVRARKAGTGIGHLSGSQCRSVGTGCLLRFPNLPTYPIEYLHMSPIYLLIS
jgi:hypothetical protein